MTATGSHQTLAAQWRDALKDGTTETLLGAMNWTDGNACQEVLAIALSLGPDADSLVERLVKTGRVTGSYHGDWIKTAARRDLAIDWAAALPTMEKLLGRKALGRDLDCAWDDLVKQDFRGAGMVSRDSTAEALLGMVRYSPRVAARASKKNEETKLFFLSVMDPASTWSRKARLDPEALLLSGMAANEFIRLLDGGEGPRTPMEQWLESQTTHQAAWDRLEAKDREAGRREAAWQAEWLPDRSRFEDSKLAQWMVSVTRQQAVGKESPLDHPALEVPYARGEVSEGAARQSYTRLLMANAMEPTNAIDQQLKIHNAFRLNKRVGWTGGGEWTSPEDVRRVPVDTLAIGVSHHTAWSKQKLMTEEGARQLQSWGDDPRLGSCLREWTGPEIVEITLAQPLWRTWRNGKGESLLALWVREKEEIGRMTTMSQRAVVSLARQAPELLMNEDGQGRKVLERLALNDQAQAAVRKALLEQEVVPGREASKARARVL